MPDRVAITGEAADVVRRLTGTHGPVMFHQSGGCCDGSSPMCFPAGEFITGAGDVRVGRLEVDGLDGTTFFAPTLLADVTPDMLISSEETFGPIAAVTAFDDEDEVVALANDTEYGLAAYVYTNDLSTAIRVTEKLRFGMVGINDINPTSAAAPFGGVKGSGLGREGGYEGIDEYLDTKLVGISI